MLVLGSRPDWRPSRQLEPHRGLRVPVVDRRSPFQLLELLNHLVNNWGLAIILLTLTVKLFLYPLSAAAYRSMANMKKFAPEMRRLRGAIAITGRNCRKR